MQWVKGRLRDKVIELLETGRLAKLDAKKKNPRLCALVHIARIWGVGPVTAAKVYGMGYTSIEDLRKPKAAAVLTVQQQIGVKHYEDFLAKIPRYVACLQLSWKSPQESFSTLGLQHLLAPKYSRWKRLLPMKFTR